MTTERELRHLLVGEAGGPSTTGPGWEDVVRRGRRRQRARRAQRGVLAALAVGAVVTSVMLSDADPRVDTVTPATTTPTTATDPATGAELPKVTAARAQGVFVTVIVLVPDRFESGVYEPAFDLCADLHPRVAESADQVVIQLGHERAERGFGWVQCQHNHDSSWATIELTDPLDGRTLLDAATGADVPVIDGAPLLLPTALPAPFDVERRDELANSELGVPRALLGTPGADPVGSWAFLWTAGPRRLPAGALDGPVLELRITRWSSEAEWPTGCTEQPVEVRGVTGNLCDADPGSRLLTWVEGDGFMALEVLEILGEPLPEDIDLVAIAEGLEPLGG